MNEHQPKSGDPTGDREWPILPREQLEIEMLTVPEAADLLRIGRKLAYDLVKQGEIPHVRLGTLIRVPRYALSRAIEHKTFQP